MNDEARIKAEWDQYWSHKDISSGGGGLYDILAGIYRRFIIRNIFRHFMRKHAVKGSKALHAGCGSAQVDVGLTDLIQITELDISSNALEICGRVHGDRVQMVQGSIFDLPFDKESFHLIYNLGVMEHFTEQEIGSILQQFYRVLSPGGKLLLLWPPRIGFSVLLLDSVHFIMNRVFRMNKRLHPAEITRIRSKAHAKEMLKKNGFEIIDYYFGIKDLFTQVVIVANKKS